MSSTHTRERVGKRLSDWGDATVQGYGFRECGEEKEGVVHHEKHGLIGGAHGNLNPENRLE